MTWLTNAVPLLWLVASGAAFFFVFKPSRRWAVLGTPARALLVFVAVFLGGAALMAATRREAAAPPPKPVRSAPRAASPDPALVRAHPERYLTLFRVRADRNQAGAVLLTGAAINTSGLPIRDPRLTCRMSRGEVAAGTVTTVVHETVPAGGRLIFAAINLGQADGVWDRWACTVVEAKAG
jgi:hypothetical protein